MGKWVWSNELNTMVIKKFRLKKKIYEWNETDCLYYNVDSDEDYFFSVPYYLGAQIIE